MESQNSARSLYLSVTYIALGLSGQWKRNKAGIESHKAPVFTYFWNDFVFFFWNRNDAPIADMSGGFRDLCVSWIRAR